MTKATKKTTRCMGGGSIVGTNESGRYVDCQYCGFYAKATPRHDRTVAGEVVPGWTMRVPAHDPVERK
jgi:DNA-directed RNA polymerase subunit RPC12/RpoP